MPSGQIYQSSSLSTKSSAEAWYWGGTVKELRADKSNSSVNFSGSKEGIVRFLTAFSFPGESNNEVRIHVIHSGIIKIGRI